MFIAIDKDKKRISIENAIVGEDYFCPVCGAPLIIKAINSTNIRTYFSHKKGKDCDTFEHDMSEWHLNWQMRFPEECREVVVEKNGVKHRADVLINNTVIEFQHSPISAEEIAKRNEFYLSCNYKMVWVFDADGQIKNDIDNSTTDPMKCYENDLCWRRSKQQFRQKMAPGVITFLDYKSDVSVKQYSGQKIDIMLLMRNIGEKNLLFYKTIGYYLTRENFLKEYGVNNDAYSISDIVSYTEQIKKQQLSRTQVSGQRFITIPISTGRYSRRGYYSKRRRL